MTPERLEWMREYGAGRFPGANLVYELLDDIDRLRRGEFTEEEAAYLLKCVVARQGLTRAQMETACWEWQERTFGPRQTDGTTSLIGAKAGFDGTYDHDKEVVPGAKEHIPNAGGSV